MTNCEQDKKSLARSIRELHEVIKSNVTDTSAYMTISANLTKIYVLT